MVAPPRHPCVLPWGVPSADGADVCAGWPDIGRDHTPRGRSGHGLRSRIAVRVAERQGERKTGWRPGSSRPPPAASDPQERAQPPLVKSEYDLAAGCGFDDRGRRRFGAQRHQFAEVLAVVADVPFLEVDAGLRKPRLLRIAGGSTGLGVQNDLGLGLGHAGHLLGHAATEDPPVARGSYGGGHRAGRAGDAARHREFSPW